MHWNLGDVFDYVVKKLPSEQTALRCGEEDLTWSELDLQSNNLASALLRRGLKKGDKVAVYGRNSVEYVVALIATFKAGLIYVNVNFRYQHEELKYIFDYTDSRAIIVDREYAGRVSALRQQLTNLSLVVEINHSDPLIDGSERFSDLVSEGERAALQIDRSPDDLLFLCTGGTTGMPKAVMWRQHDIFHVVANRLFSGKGVPVDWEDLSSSIGSEIPGKFLLCPPLMHGAGMYLALNTLIYAGELILLPGEKFSPDLFLKTVEKEQISHTLFIGDAIAQPLLACLDSGMQVDLSSLRVVISSAAPWSIESKRRLLKYLPHLVILDVMGSSEAASFGRQMVTADNVDLQEAPKLFVGKDTKVFTEDFREVVPGSGEVGFIARGGPVPVGYYKAPEKSTEAFKEIGGQRYSIPGDMVMVNADGSLKFLGRGNVCINTGGEKVYPQEVELAVMSVDGVFDAVVVGAPDSRWGEKVVAVVQMAQGTALNPAAIQSAVSAQLSDYKVPKAVVEINDMARGPNGKADYKTLQKYAIRCLLERMV